VLYSKSVAVADANVYHIAIIVIVNSKIQFFVNSQLLDTIDANSRTSLVYGPTVVGVSIGIENPWSSDGIGQGKAVFSKLEIVPQQ
jgi:hypothetical protein